MKLPRQAWKDEAALRARLERAQKQARASEAIELGRHRAVAVSWLCGLTLAFSLTIGCGQPESTPSPVTPAPVATSPAPSASASPEPSPSSSQSPLANPSDHVLVNPVQNAPRAVYGAPRKTRGD